MNKNNLNLMIDDLVLHDGKPIKVKNVYKDCINFIPEVPYAQEEYWIDLDEIKLIPFTPEIMEKNKFKLNEKESEFLSKISKTKVLAYDFPEIPGNRFLIEYDTKNKVAYLTDHCLIPIRYVNEFQQLLRLMSSKTEQVKQILDNFIV